MESRPTRIVCFRLLLLCALSLSIGWGIRGNFGHEYGAMIPGALASIAAVLVVGRADWWRRVAYFAMFGALGWSFGGSISYMRVIAYTHSGHFPSQVYGFACLFVIGFTWGALGGAGLALPAVLDRARLTSLFPPMLAVFAAWTLQDFIVPFIERVGSSEQRHQSVLYWYDTDWIAALLAIVAVLLLAALRRRWCWASSFILHLAVGWWIGFLIVVVMVDGLGIEFRMTPPRGDNWAGALGMTGGALVYFIRSRLVPAAQALMISGIFGGFGFAAATFLKLVEVKYVPLLFSELFGPGAWQTNWHSVLEQTYGFFNGIGVAVTMWFLARRLPRTVDAPPLHPWTEAAAVAFVLLVIPGVNLVKIVPTWIQQRAIPAELYGLPSRAWFIAGFALICVAAILLVRRHRRQPLAVLPESWLGRGQLLYLLLLWVVVIGNLMRAVPPFPEQRLITEGVIHLNAVLGTVLILLWPQTTSLPDRERASGSARSLLALAAVGVVVLVTTTAVFSWGTRAMHGDRFVGQAGYHTRFGPDAKTGKPPSDKPHP